jgi:hypothetical protein
VVDEHFVRDTIIIDASHDGCRAIATLKGLEQDGPVTRTVYPTIPPHVDYELTELGRMLMVPLRSLYAWAVKHRPAMLAARRKFAEKERLAAQQKRFTTPG